MSLSTSRLAYRDCFTLLDRALDEPRGVRIEVPSGLNSAIYLRMRIHHARQIDRADNEKTYPDPEHHLHGCSEYDVLVCRIEETADAAWLYLDKQKVEIGTIESIPDGYQIEGPKPMLQIEGPKGEPPMPTATPAPSLRRR